MREVLITRDVRYELRMPLPIGSSVPTPELHDMTVVNDSGPQIFIEQEKAA